MGCNKQEENRDFLNSPQFLALESIFSRKRFENDKYIIFIPSLHILLSQIKYDLWLNF